MTDFLLAPLFYVFLVALSLVCFGIGAYLDVKKETAFMKDCVAHEPEYRCKAMWRAGESHVVPMPVVIPGGR